MKFLFQSEMADIDNQWQSLKMESKKSVHSPGYE